MSPVIWQNNINFINRSNPLVQGVLNDRGTDWIGFLDALGKVEGEDKYDAQNTLGYIGIYQFAPFNNSNSIFIDLDFSNNIGRMMGATTNAAYKANPIAQELSAIMEFSGIPDITKPFSSKYSYVRKAAPWAGLSQSNFDSMIGQTFTIQWKNGNQDVGTAQTITLTKAGISAAAHLVGQGGVALAMRKIYDQTHDNNGNLISPLPTVALDISGGYVGTTYVNFADGNGIAFSTYVQLFQNFDVSPLTDAADGLNWTQFNQFSQDLITYRKDKIIDYLTTKKQEVAMSISYGTTDYRETIRSILQGLSLPTDNLSTIDGQVVLAGANNSKFTDKADLIFGVGNVNNVLIAGNGDDVIYGGEGNDFIAGEIGGDTLYGEEGNDQIIGGADNDILEGGAGDDKYYFQSGDGSDKINDNEGKNQIIWEDNNGNLHVEKTFYKTAEAEWKSADGTTEVNQNSPYKMVFPDGTTVELGESISSFDINLKDVPANPTTTNTITGDHKQDKNDLLSDTSANDRIEGLSGDDVILAWNGGNDWILGGEGNDGIAPGIGDDIVEGNAGSDVLYGEEGSDKVFGENYGEMETLIAEGENAENINARGDLATGNAGDDFVYGSNSKDVLFGGAGNDLIVGGGGDDIIYSDLDFNSASTEWSVDRDANNSITLNNVSVYDPDFKGNDVIYAGSGDDYVIGGRGDDEINAGTGNDVVYGGAGDDFISGGEGDDYLVGDDDPVSMLAGEEGENFISGGNGNDQIWGGYKADVLFGGEGNDFIQGDWGPEGGSDDYIDGEDGDDVILGMGGNDTIFGGDGNDNLHGDADNVPISSQGDDYIDGEAGNDIILGYGGNDTLIGGEGNDELQGNEGDDYIEGGDGDDTIFGDEGTDTIFGGAGNDYIYGGAGDDEIYGGEGNDKIVSNEGSDYIFGGAGNNTINGGGGDDYIEGGVGNDTLDGGSGNDTYVFGYGSGQDVIVDVDNTAGNIDTIALIDNVMADNISLGQSGDDFYLIVNKTTDRLKLPNWFVSDENKVEQIQFKDGTLWDRNTIVNQLSADNFLIGTSASDYIGGSSGDDYMDGGDGNDTLIGYEGNDTLIGGSGGDILNGGVGNDTYIFSRGSGVDIIWDYDTAIGNIDSIVFDGSINQSDVSLQRNVDDLVIAITGTTDSVTVKNYFFDDNSRYQIENIEFADGTVWGSNEISQRIILPGNIIYGGSGDDTLQGTAGNEMLYGWDGNDTLFGWAGIDKLVGGAGNDTLDGGEGNDKLYGNTGNDTYIFGRGSGKDTIIDIDTTAGNTDTIVLGADITSSDISIKRTGDNLVLSIKGTNDTLTVKDWFLNEDPQYQVEIIQFADGMVWGVEDIKQLVIQGTEGDDTLIGYSTADTIYGLGGNDQIWGNAGNDRLYGGDGYDYLSGDNGNDTLYGNAEKDSLDGGSGDDVLDGGEGNDVLFGGNSDSNDGNDVLLGGEGDDLLFNSGGINVLDGGLGDDYLLGEVDSLYGSTNGENTYIIRRGEGFDIIGSLMPGSLANDAVIFGEGITPDDLSVQVNDDPYCLHGNGSALAIGIGNNEGVLIGNTQEGLNKWYPWFTVEAINNYYGMDISNLNVNRFVFANGQELTFQDILARADGGIIGYQEGTSGDDTLLGSVADDEIYGGEGNDKIDSRDRNDIIDGGLGNDIIAAGAGNDEVYSYDGDDIVAGGKGNDSIVGNNGNNTYAFNRGDGQDTIDNYDTNTESADTLSFGTTIKPEDVFGYVETNSYGETNLCITIKDSADKITISLWNPDDLVASQNNEIERAQFIDNAGNARIFDLTGIVGLLKDSLLASTETNPIALFTAETSGYELIGLPIAGGDNAVAYAQTGNLFASPIYAINGTEGDDLLMGNAGNNLINGEAGNDTLYGANNNDTINGGIGNDYIDGKSGDDTLNGGEGNDYVYGYLGNDIINGDAGDDILYGGEGNDIINGGTGNDYLEGEAGDDMLSGGEGNDYVYGYFGNDTINGDAGDDILYGGPDNDIINGGTDNDYLEGEAGDDVLSGGEGNDYVYGYFGNDVINGNEGDDILYGGPDNDIINGGIGNDYLEGEAGDDTLIGGTGNDYLSGYIGNDTYIFNNGDGIDAINDCDTTAGNTDTVQFEANPLDIIFNRLGNDLNIQTNSTNDQVTVQNWYTDSAYQTETLQTADGKHLHNNQVAQLIQAMATFCTTNGVTWNQAIEQKPAEVQQVLAQYWSQT